MKHSRGNLTAAIAVALLFLSPLLLPPAVAGSGVSKDDWSSLKTGQDVYNAACISCHGARGNGADPTNLGFDPLPPDFTDCAFTSREMSNDWVGIAWGGGPMKSFSPMMPAFGDALSRAQLEAVVAHVKGFCPEKKWPPGEFNLPKALYTGKAFPENEVAWSVSSTLSEPVSIGGKFVVAKRVGARHQIEGAIPFEVKQIETTDANGQVDTRWGEGAGDIAVAWKSVMWFSPVAGNIGSVTLDVFFPTGDEADEISDGIFAFEPAFAFGQIIPHVGFLQLQGGAELSTNTDKKSHGVFWRGAFGHTFRRGGFGRAVSPMIEVLGGTELGQAQTVVDWDIVPGIQIALSKRQHIRFGTGVLIPLTDFEERQMEVKAYLVWDWYDGGFTEGWK